jgi:hypothetical protein
MSETQVNQIASAVEEMTFTNESLLVEQKNIIMPPTWFNLMKISNYDMLSHISSLTNQFCDLPPDLANWIIYDAQTRPYSFYGTIPAPPWTDVVKQIIGINGYYLKLTTQNSLVDFIWHDRVRNEFQFWGEYQSCVKAMKEIRYRICKYVEMYKHAPAPAPVPVPVPAPVTVPAPAPVFYNDIAPNPAVCLEAIIELDENDEYKKTVASKYYPDAC